MELDSWNEYDIGSLKITITPETSTNSSGIPTSIPLDLDTSIIIYEVKSKTVFYNNVDNPNSHNGFKLIKNYINEKYKCDIHAAAIGCTAASEYPQMFLGINQDNAKKAVINKVLDRLKMALDILQPLNYIPAGGKAVYWGKYASLQKYVATPSDKVVIENLKRLKYTPKNIEYYHYNLLSKINKKNLYNKITKKDITHLYYFPTPYIFSGDSEIFQKELFYKFCKYYVTEFIEIIDILALRSLKYVLYPSSIAVEEQPLNMFEYTVSKAAGEIACSILSKKYPHINIYKPRIIRLATDQTVTLVPYKNDEPSYVMLDHLRKMYGIKFY